MFYDLFAVDKIRRISSTNIMYYPNGLLHPNRILPVHDIVAVINGAFQVYQNNTPFEVKSGDFLILPAGYHHYAKKMSNSSVFSCYVHLEQEPGDMPYTTDNKLAANYSSAHTTGKLPCSQVILPTIIHSQNHPSLIKQIKEISMESVSYSPYLKAKASTKMTKLLIDLSMIAMEAHIPNNNLANECLHIMQDNAYQLSLEDMAKKLNISKSTLIRNFEKATGTSFHKYFMHIRLNMACDLLQTTPEPIHSIAGILGFCDEAHFRNSFKRKFGCTPNEYRNKNKMD